MTMTRKRKRKGKGEFTFADFTPEMLIKAAEGVRQEASKDGREYGFDRNTVVYLAKHIEAWRAPGAPPMSDLQMWAIAALYGECIRRTYGGEWKWSQEYGSWVIHLEKGDWVLRAAPLNRVINQYKHGWEYVLMTHFDAINPDLQAALHEHLDKADPGPDKKTTLHIEIPEKPPYPTENN
jgi:hypothetical protein